MRQKIIKKTRKYTYVACARCRDDTRLLRIETAIRDPYFKGGTFVHYDCISHKLKKDMAIIPIPNLCWA